MELCEFSRWIQDCIDNADKRNLSRRGMAWALVLEAQRLLSWELYDEFCRKEKITPDG